MRSRRLLSLLFALWLCAMFAALWLMEHERLVFDVFCIAPTP
jgi:hypothetical protein